MHDGTDGASVSLYATCPPSGAAGGDAYLRRVIDTAVWSERHGCRGILVYTDNSLVDPWLLSQIIIQHTRALVPLVAVQPAYMHPYWAAKTVATLGHLHGRAVALNMVAGGFTNDLAALADPTPHDERYDRLLEYTRIVKALLAGPSPVTLRGRYYSVDRLRLVPPLPEPLTPLVFVSGSSEAGMAAARALGAVAVEYPKPAAAYAAPGTGGATPERGVRFGLVAREHDDEAWRVARARFPEDRRGALTHQLAMKVSDSVWHRQLSDTGPASRGGDGVYWLAPFRNYHTMCPYLVGSYDRVAGEAARYIRAGFGTFILDVPASEEECAHTQRVFELALRRAAP